MAWQFINSHVPIQLQIAGVSQNELKQPDIEYVKTFKASILLKFANIYCNPSILNAKLNRATIKVIITYLS